jgi:hypothetical protein
MELACLRCVGLCPILLTTVSPESSIFEILEQLCWRPQNKGERLCGREGWRSILLGRYRLGTRELGTWIVVGVGKPESLRVDWFGNPSTLWNRPCGFISLAWW